MFVCSSGPMLVQLDKMPVKLTLFAHERSMFIKQKSRGFVKDHHR